LERWQFQSILKYLIARVVIVVHIIRQSFGYIPYKKHKEFSDDLKMVYKAPNREMTDKYLVELKDKGWSVIFCNKTLKKQLEELDEFI
jgi:transposase-like protein